MPHGKFACRWGCHRGRRIAGDGRVLRGRGVGGDWWKDCGGLSCMGAAGGVSGTLFHLAHVGPSFGAFLQLHSTIPIHHHGDLL